MGITDRLKDLTKKAEDTAAEHKDQIEQAVQKAGAVADERTGGRYSEQIEKAGAKVQTLVDRLEAPPGSQESGAAAQGHADTPEGPSLANDEAAASGHAKTPPAV